MKLTTKLEVGISAMLFSLLAKPVLAVCPVCIVAVGAGLGLSEYLGIDDAIAGLWIGGLLIAISIWTIDWLNRKQYKLGNKKIRDILVFFLYYALTIWPLWSQGYIGGAFHQLWGLDKLIVGIALGSIIFTLTNIWYLKLKKDNGGRAYFPFQKVVMPLAALLILSLIMQFFII